MTIEFYATLPDIQSAISVGGDGARIKLDIPETDLPNVIKLVLHKGKLLKVKIEAVEDNRPIGAVTTKDLI
jgi:hypothetical protein